jgi:hypothetical protein
MSIDHSNGRVSVLDGDIFYSPNCKEPAPAPLPGAPQGYIFHDSALRLEDYVRPRWWTEPYTWLSFIPLRPSLSGIAFGRLNAMPPIQREGQGYHLRTDVMESWKRLENRLIWATSFLSRKFDIPSLRPPHPSQFGYTQTFKTFGGARKQAFISKEWFMMWMGLLSYCIAFSTPCETAEPSEIPRWVEFLASLDFPQSWLSGVMASTAASFSDEIPRAGVFINPIEERPIYGYRPTIQWFCRFHVPVWYPWTARHASIAQERPAIAALAPPAELLQQATTFLVHTPIPQPQLRTTMGERKCSSWTEFFRRRTQRQVEKLKHESSKERQARLQREKNPPVSNTAVFEWVRDDNNPSEWIRRRAPKRFNEDTITSFGIQQRRYDPYENEWDLCEEFGDPDSDSDDDDDGADPFSQPPNPAAATVTPFEEDVTEDWRPNPDEIHQSSVDDYANINPFHRSLSPIPHERLDAPDDSPLASGSVAEILSHHYGFVPPLTDLPPPSFMGAKSGTGT